MPKTLQSIASRLMSGSSARAFRMGKGAPVAWLVEVALLR